MSERVNFPSVSVTVPTLVPSICTDAPAMGSPYGSRTVPVTTLPVRLASLMRPGFRNGLSRSATAGL